MHNRHQILQLFAQHEPLEHPADLGEESQLEFKKRWQRITNYTIVLQRHSITNYTIHLQRHSN